MLNPTTEPEGYGPPGGPHRQLDSQGARGGVPAISTYVHSLSEHLVRSCFVPHLAGAALSPPPVYGRVRPTDSPRHPLLLGMHTRIVR